MKKLFIALVAALLTACGGGGSSEPAQQQTKAACKPVRIQLFGDSTQWGYLAEGGGVRASVYPELALQQAMNERFGIGAVEVSTRAVSGTNSRMLVEGTDGLNKPWPQSVDADIIVINHGINDVAYKINVETYKNNLRTFAIAPALVVFETPLPVSTATVSYDDAMREVAAEVKAPLIDSRKYVQSLPDWWQYALDGVHATSEGYSAIARNAKFPVLAPIVANLICK